MVAPREAITLGKDDNFFAKITVSNTDFDTTNADVVFNIKFQKSFSLVNEGSVVVEYSFNGNTLHGDLTPGTPTEAIFFDNRTVSKIWFRVASGSADVRVEAWGG